MGWQVNRHGYGGGCAGERLQSEVDIIRAGEYGYKSARKVKQIVVDCTDEGDDVVTVAGAIPAGACDVLVSARVIAAITGEAGIASFSLGVTGDADRFAAGKALAAGTTVGPADYAADQTAPGLYPAATDILITSNGSKDIEGGKVRLVIEYAAVTPPTA
jgi:hypothetical protein